MLNLLSTRLYLVLAVTVLSACSHSTAAETSGSSQPQSDWETIRPDYSNVRGLNYIASYAPSDVAMWRHYDHQQIDRELGMIKGMGVNSIRVWLAWVVYDVEREKFIEKFSDFLSLCGKHRISVMPILWDSCFGDKKATYDDVHDWVANPGTEHVANPDFRTTGDEYVKAVVTAGRESDSLLIWDIMNEPGGKGINPWLEHYCRLVKRLDPKHPITIGWAHAVSNETSATWVDVMSYHPYGIFNKNRQVWTEQVREVAQKHGKPILVTEAGAPAWGQRYEECIASFEGLGVGFYLFEAMSGTNRFRNVCGFFYSDGGPREIAPIEAFRGLAKRHGIATSGQYPAATRTPPYKVSGSKEVAELMLHWDEKEPTAETHAQRGNLMRWTFISLAWGGVLRDHLPKVQDLRRQADEATAKGDLERVKKVNSQLAALAAKLLVEHGFIAGK